MKNNLKLLSFILILSSSYFLYRWKFSSYLHLAGVQKNYQHLLFFYRNHPYFMISTYFAFYILTTVLSVPMAATLLTLLGGALFGLYKGTLIVSLASTIGATLAFLMARFFLQDWVQERFQRYSTMINKGLEKEGSLYLFALRLSPLAPFFAVNLVMGITRFSTLKYIGISLIGMLPATALYVYAGTQLIQIHQLSDLMSPTMVLTLTFLGIFPWVAKKAVSFNHKHSTIS